MGMRGTNVPGTGGGMGATVRERKRIARQQGDAARQAQANRQWVRKALKVRR